jgi:chemotaxis response regulator CheB
MKIGIINDLALAVEAIRRVLTPHPEYQILWIARNGREGLEQCRACKPDLIIMDLIMPEMDGVQATTEIMRTNPCAVLIVTSSVTEHLDRVFETMGVGALGAVSTPTLLPGGDLQGGEELLEKLIMIGRLVCPTEFRQSRGGAPAPDSGKLTELAAIGASTGGPKVLASLLSQLHRPFPVPVVLIQHIDRQFAEGLAQWLGEHSRHHVELAKEGDIPQPGCVYLAGTNDHLLLMAGGRFRYAREPVENPYRPSVDVFFESLTRVNDLKGVAVLLTGMGRDGAAGLLQLRRHGWHTIAQDEATSVVFGMPKAAIELQAALDILPLSRIAEVMYAHTSRR